MVSPYALTRPGGVQGQAIGLAQALGAVGLEVTLVGPVDRGMALPDTAGASFVIGRVADVQSNGSVAPLALSPLAAARAERFVHHGGFDVAHLHEPLAPLAAYGILLAGPVPLVGTYHRSGASQWMCRARPLLGALGRRVRVRAAVSASARDTAVAAYGGDYEVLFNGIDVERFAAAEPLRDPAGRCAVVFLGRHEERKGLEVFLDAFATVDEPAVAWVIGQGPDTVALRRRHPESDRLQWLGVLGDAEVASRLAGADVLCAPSLYGESFGVVLLEGMAAGCAVVASDIDGYRQAGGGHAALVGPGDATALARALGSALIDARGGDGLSSPRARAGALAHARAWSMEVLAERYVELYQQAARTAGGRRS